MMCSAHMKSGWKLVLKSGPQEVEFHQWDVSPKSYRSDESSTYLLLVVLAAHLMDSLNNI